MRLLVMDAEVENWTAPASLGFDDSQVLQTNVSHLAQGTVLTVTIPISASVGYHRIVLVGATPDVGLPGVSFTVLAANQPACQAMTPAWPPALVAILHTPTFGSISSLESANFGNVLTGTPSGPAVLRWRNITTAPERIAPRNLTPSAARNYLLSWGCHEGWLAAGRTCIVRAFFKPRDSGILETPITLTVGATTPITALLMGNSGTPVLQLNQPSALFPIETVGTSNTGVQLWVTSANSDFPVIFQRAWIAGPDAASFSAPGVGGTGCSTTCPLGVGYQPRHAGQLHATLMLADNAPDSPRHIALAGYALRLSGPPSRTSLPLILVSPDALAVFVLDIDGAPLAQYALYRSPAPGIGSGAAETALLYTRHGAQVSLTQAGGLTGAVSLTTLRGMIHTPDGISYTLEPMLPTSVGQAQLVANDIAGQMQAGNTDSVYRFATMTVHRQFDHVAFARRLARMVQPDPGIVPAVLLAQSYAGDKATYHVPIGFTSGHCLINLAFEQSAWRFSGLDCGQAHLP